MPTTSPTLPTFVSDADLVARVRLTADDTAMHTLFTRHHRAATAVAGRHLRDRADIDDAVAESFTRVFERLEVLRDPSRFRAFLLATVRNLVHDRWRAEARICAGTVEVVEASSVEVSVERHDDAARLLEAVAGLPRRQRHAISRFYWDEARVADIAGELGLSVNATTQLLFRARAALAKKTELSCRRRTRS